MHNDLALFERLAALQPTAAEPAPIQSGPGEPAAIDVPRLVADWLAAGPQVFRGDERRRLDAICRQIDVRHRLSVSYRDDWKRVEPETGVTPETLAGVVAVLLANAGTPGFASANDDDSDDESHGDGGWGLKCANSALKALDLMDALPAAPELRAWAVAVLDDRTRPSAARGDNGKATS